MKKTILALSCLPLLLLACNGGSNTQKPQTQDSTAIAPPEPEIFTDIYGSYVGDFVNADSEMEDDFSNPDIAKINVSITHITAKGATGKSVVKGYDRPMSGQVTQSGTKYTFVMDEPGDDKHDGRFDFYIQGDSLVGTWQAYDSKNVKSPKKKFVLRKKPFVYNANLMLPQDWEYVDFEGVKEKRELYKNDDGTTDTFINQVYRFATEAVYTLNASKNKLSEKQLKNLKKLDLEILRNTIFARHGFSFKKKAVRQFFDQVEWYVPVSNNVDATLTPLERENIALLQRFEKYAEDNYDTFGR